MPIDTAYVAHERLLVDVAATITSTRLDYTGEPSDASGAVTVTVTRGDGTALLTNAATSHPSGQTGIYTATLTAAQNDRLDLLLATWTEASGATWQTLHEIVGGVWFTAAQARARDENLTDTTLYPTERIIAVRSEAEHLLEDATGVAWVPRYRRVRVRATGSATLVAPVPYVRTVRSARIYTTATSYNDLTAGELAAIVVDDAGSVRRTDGGWWPCGADVVLEIEHGRDTPTPHLRDAAIKLLRHRLNAHRTGIPDRAETFVDAGGGRFVISTPGQRGAITGIPEVDAAIAAHRFDDIGLA